MLYPGLEDPDIPRPRRYLPAGPAPGHRRTPRLMASVCKWPELLQGHRVPERATKAEDHRQQVRALSPQVQPLLRHGMQQAPFLRYREPQAGPAPAHPGAGNWTAGAISLYRNAGCHTRSDPPCRSKTADGSGLATAYAGKGQQAPYHLSPEPGRDGSPCLPLRHPASVSCCPYGWPDKS